MASNDQPSNLHLPPNQNNQILSALPPTDYERLSPHLERVELSFGDVLQEMREPIDYVYFPVGALISLMSPVNDHAIEFSLVGREGLVGIPALLGGESTITRAVVQIAAAAIRIDAQVLKAEFMRGEGLHQQVLFYLQWVLTQVTQNAACQAHHLIEPRLARWLLTIHEQLQRDDLQLTQQFIAELLNTRRATITQAAGHLQQAGLIQYSRGVITIVDQAGLEECACECYALLREERRRLRAMSQSTP
ncbi:MAG: Crp/Fnr family transcriptional regulator [Leptolyngbyaceae bacterium]|nr:Crp/Fnr family transcriptional regulator [Leptolyngbyaceae bacterium]